jgi:multiple sugar transport system ATP-binding protein
MAYSAEQGLWRGEISVVEQLGSEAFFYVAVPGMGTLTVRAADERRFHAGDTIYLSPPAAQCHLFDATGRRIAAPHTAG